MTNFWLKTKKPILALAPMAGITDSAFRLMCKKFGADVVYSEMTSIDALYYDSEKTLKMLEFSKKERPVVLQLFGKRPEFMQKAVKRCEEAGFSGIDINFGCPARKVVCHEGGITLLKNLDLCYELIQAACEATKLPVSIKTRVSIGQGKEKVTVLKFLEKIENLPVSALMLHGRTYEQGFSGEVDYQMMKLAKEKWSGVVLGNGGLNSPEDVKKMLDMTGVDGVGLGRGLYGRPWLFEQVNDFLKKGEYDFPDIDEIKKIALEHAKLNFKNKKDHGIVELRKHLCWYFRGFPGANEMRRKMVRVNSVEDVKNALKND
ncbi:MAG: tRNA-dihydrouridine synthase [Parcubacteria group bacterium]